MPPQLAVFICTVFVISILSLERRALCDVSPALWIPTVWILLIASRPLALWFGETGNNESGSALDRWVLMGLTIAATVLVAQRRFDWAGTLRQHKWLLVLLAYMLASTLWSEITLIALRRWTRELIVILMALFIMSEANPRQALASLLRRSAYILIPFSLVLVKYYPEMGRQYGRWSGIEMWTGVTTQKNQLGALCTISIFFLLWALYENWPKVASHAESRRRWADVAVIVIGLYVLNGADSSTSLATLIVGVVAFLGLRLFRRFKILFPQAALLGILALLISFGASAPFLGGSNVAIFSAALNRNDTLTGRTDVWEAVLPAVKQHPLLGFGFGSFWTDARREHYDIPTAHNGYLDILLELGAAGLAFYTIWLLSCARQVHRALAWDYEWASFAICFLLMVVIYNTTESALNDFSEHMTAVVLLTSVVVPKRPIVAKVRAKSRFVSGGDREENIGMVPGERIHQLRVEPER